MVFVNNGKKCVIMVLGLVPCIGGHNKITLLLIIGLCETISKSYATLSLSKCHYDIAKVVHKLYKHEFKCVNIKNWYQYNNHRWNFIGDGVELRETPFGANCSGVLVIMLESIIQIIQQLTDETQRNLH